MVNHNYGHGSTTLSAIVNFATLRSLLIQGEAISGLVHTVKYTLVSI